MHSRKTPRDPPCILSVLIPQYSAFHAYLVVKAFTKRRALSPTLRLGPWSGPMRSASDIVRGINDIQKVTFDQGLVEPDRVFQWRMRLTLSPGADGSSSADKKQDPILIKMKSMAGEIAKYVHRYGRDIGSESVWKIGRVR